jgi:uncharacterized protein
MSTKLVHESRSALIPTKLAAFESRADGDVPTLIAGYGAVYYRDVDPGSQYLIDVDLVERLRPGCFDAFLASDRDCYCAPYHDENRILGRRSRLLKLASDDRGLRYSLPYDASDPDHQAIGAKLRRGDVSGSSVRFLVLAEEWRRDELTDMIIREVIKAEILHLGPVIGEAYTSTTAEIRSADGAWEMLQARKAAFMANEYEGHDSLLIEIDALLLD